MCESFDIKYGPSKYDLQKALFDRKGNNGKAHKVRFTTSTGLTLIVAITMVEAKDSSGEYWNIEGRTRLCTPELDANVNCIIHGWFNTDTRKGHFVESDVPIARVQG